MAVEAGRTIDVAVYGGAALAIAFDLREMTRDVDAVVHGDPAFLRHAAVEVASERGWPEDWFNDAVKGFRASREVLDGFVLPGARGGLRVYVPSPEYLFAMKCMAMRLDDPEVSDVADIEHLAAILDIHTTQAALDIVESFYPRSEIPAKVQFGVEEIMTRLAAKPRRPRP